ncbi:TatD family hydrolase [Methanobacterium formicicum]|uniref:TatD-related deoxyribonuclease n=1 Tax=Methanobacterium formicicum (strain DSM 3637 / PP1) TaxID=1204725 RepID=K2RPJ2_METFP|nr:TatD family hydrolase [Methanobacterium formicicum]EKF84685.1 TatD-related deoxyribonuclease [Methanobacterium formicicum DSM 3637]
MIDAHIHADCRPYEDFETMAVAGIESALTLAHDPMRMTTSAVVLDHFHRILDNDFKRAKSNGLTLKAALGLHPRSICQDYKLVLRKLPWFLDQEEVIALGEVGLETASNIEREVFRTQLKMADELDMKVAVHTPRRNKREITIKTLSIIHSSIDPSLVVVDHVDTSIIDLLEDFEGMLGITVQPQKMTPQEAVELLEGTFDEYGPEKFMLDSDMSSSPSDPLSVPKTVHQLKMAGWDDEKIEMLSQKNAANFYGF